MIKNKQECDVFSESDEATPHLSGVGRQNCLLFYPHPDHEAEQQKRVECASIMIESLVGHYSRNADLSGLLKKFTLKAKEYQKSDTDYLATYLFAARLAYCLISDISVYDHEAMLQVFAFLGKESTKEHGAEIAASYYLNGLNLLNSLSCEDRALLLEKSPIAAYILRHTNITDVLASPSPECRI